ncbi:hypothetical protein PUNSTDRAFT_135077 [Punctularia strigosozonata HHB-11173 SS5]|uniref:uncharacterized protein n=1 Tax=Punctularia strigosozonata (strain HHB-11173) TaxID=741275 RepID=UPI0004417B00|nr:uncharacterized protein PUNSTDRAFT_135077 [Punctularia strigosozonata HHB-11173 SS5]EIN07551.1 hypothetical protein PUNSTDRAFT_135077 [Punctularia strigosozonata HHB-11173 SS5]
MAPYPEINQSASSLGLVQWVFDVSEKNTLLLVLPGYIPSIPTDSSVIGSIKRLVSKYWHIVVSTISPYILTIGQILVNYWRVAVETISPYIVTIKKHVIQYWRAAAAWCAEHPALVAALVVALGVGVLFLVAQPLILAILSGVGFGVQGVVAGSCAAAYHSAVLGGVIVEGSAFSILQSTAALGAVPWPISLGFAIVGVALVAGAIKLSGVF